jgi:hypothetical protein
MAQAKSRLPPKDPSVELIGAEPVERLRGRDRALRPARTAPRRKRPDLNFGLMAANYRALVRALDRSSLQANTKKSRAVWMAAVKGDYPVPSVAGSGCVS